METHPTAPNCAAGRIVALYVSPGHNYFGRHGHPAAEHPLLAVAEVECVAGRGLVGDRFFDYKSDYAGQITFFAEETYHDLVATLTAPPRDPSVFRRNALTRGLDLPSLIGHLFTLQGVTFLGVTEAKPCYWMDQAFAPGAEAALRGRGGLRARILTSGRLRRDASA